VNFTEPTSYLSTRSPVLPINSFEHIFQARCSKRSLYILLQTSASRLSATVDRKLVTIRTVPLYPTFCARELGELYRQGATPPVSPSATKRGPAANIRWKIFPSISTDTNSLESRSEQNRFFPLKNSGQVPVTSGQRALSRSQLPRAKLRKPKSRMFMSTSPA